VFVHKGEEGYKIRDCHLYKAVNKFIREVRSTRNEAPCILVGTKNDTREDPYYREGRRFLPIVYGERVAQLTGCLAYIETSAKSTYNIEVLKQAIVCAEQYCIVPKPIEKKKCMLM
jgi:GTPase SAR1 family protein